MRRRYKRLRYGELKLGEYFTNYIRWLSTPRERQLNVAATRTYLAASIRPYGLDFSVKALVNRPVDLGILGRLLVPSNQSELSTPPEEGAAKVKGFVPARVSVEYGPDESVTAVSRITGIRYRRYSSLTRIAAPFGRARPTDLEFEARDLIREAYLQLVADWPVRRISFRAEARKEY